MGCNCKKLKNIVNKTIIIGNAVIDYSFNDETANIRGMERINFCSNCEFSQNFILYKAIPDTLFPQIQGKRCTKCGCSLSLKIRSTDKCPINKW